MRFSTVFSSISLLATLSLAAPIANPEANVVVREEAGTAGAETYCYIKRDDGVEVVVLCCM
ncbi:hypothetical protein N7456_013048 [Penicillium angulare]|uniref:Uncharacterized protein n=1 Tax=Penicillium angulare TaxID=116970 RepID=A0A9W9EKZ3_9EURO|nr:hypothetical protein N7456_013048 [Penicillium angulare]